MKKLQSFEIDMNNISYFEIAASLLISAVLQKAPHLKVSKLNKRRGAY